MKPKVILEYLRKNEEVISQPAVPVTRRQKTERSHNELVCHGSPPPFRTVHATLPCRKNNAQQDMLSSS